MKKITLEDLRAWMNAQLVETQDAEERQEIIDKAKLQAFYLGALDKYARVAKQPQDEFWDSLMGCDYEYKVGRLPEWGNPAADDLSSLEDAYDKGEDEGDAYAEGYAREILPQLVRDAVNDCFAYDATKEAYERARRHADELWRRYRSDKHGWGENWWED